MKALKLWALAGALLIGAAAVPVMPVTAFADEEEQIEVPTSGKCGENCTWSYDAETKTLTISGTGDMYEYTLPEWDNYVTSLLPPWASDQKRNYYGDVNVIENIVVEEGITGVSGGISISCFAVTCLNAIFQFLL